MRLTVKITLAILLGIALIFSIYSYYSIQREREQLKKSLSREARHLGESLRVMVTEIWQQRGEQEAISFLRRANRVHEETMVRWVWIEEDTPVSTQPRVPLDKLEPLHEEETVALLAASEDGHDYLLTYLPLLIDNGQKVGAIELTESMNEMHDYVNESLRRSAVVVAAMVTTSLLLVGTLGSFWVGRPMRKLHAQAERIGTGDFSTSLELHPGSDELAELGQTIERMRAQLAEARAAEQAATQEKIEALEELRHTERLATLGKLSAGMAHELGTPLNVISGRAKLIRSADIAAEDVTRSAKIIGEQAERMTSIMRQLLSFARRGEVRKQRVELNQLLRSVLPLLEPARKEYQVALALEESAQPLSVSADPGQLQQVLLNLALNGIQAMPPGGQLRLLVTAANQVSPPETAATAEAWCSLQVIDQGQGISPEDLSHIFDPFFTTKEIGQGTGLGLSIAYGIIEEHGGWIEVDSTPGQGSRFAVFLPLEENGAAA